MSTLQEDQERDTSDAYREPAEGAPNVGTAERILSGLAGLGLVALAGRVPRGRLLLALGGVGLAYRAATGRCWCYRKLGIDRAQSHPAVGVRARRGARIDFSLSIERPAAELYAFWRQLDNLPRVMRHLVSVTPRDDGRSHWVARGPLGAPVEWDAEIINARPGELIAWRSLPGSVVDSAGSVRFVECDPGGRTILRLEMKYDPPGGRLTAAVAELFGAGLQKQVRDDLTRFKQRMEAGEPSTAPSP